MIKFPSILFFILIPLFCLNAQTKISSIEITGNEYLTKSNILELMLSKKDGNFKEEQFRIDLKTIRDKYKSSGFLFTKFEEESVLYSEDSSFADITLKINEGEKVVIGEILIDGNTVLNDNEILNLFVTKKGDVLNEAILNDDLLELLKTYEAKELPFAKISVKDISVYKSGEKNKLKLELFVTENSRVKIDQVKIKGNERAS